MDVFLDTMVFLHYSPIEHIDFCELLETASATIVVPRITLRELDKHKSTHASSKIRERARRTLSYLEEIIRLSRHVRDGINLEFVPQMPRIDMAQYGLNADWNDDLLIAAVLERQARSSNEKTVLVTHDTAVRLTCDTLGIRTIELPERFRLPPELDERDEEIRQLRRDLQKLQNARPTLSVVFAGGSETTAKFGIQPPSFIDNALIAQRLQDIRAALPELPRKTELEGTPGFAARAQQLMEFSAVVIPEEEYQRYNRQREEYFRKFEQYQYAVVEFENRVKRSFRFSIEIVNSGSAPAEEVDISIHFPDGFQMYTEDDLPSEPSKPKPPERPRSKFEMMTVGIRDFHPHLMVPSRDLHNRFSSFTLKKTNSFDLADQCRRIKHGDCFELPELFVIFDSYEEARSFHCDYTLRVANLPELVEGQLHFIIEHDVE